MADVQLADFRDRQHARSRVVIQPVARVDFQPQDVGLGGGRGKADVGVPLIALASLDVPAYPADALPPELAAVPVEDPGSRRLSK